ncbi:hypothetical protein Pta6605_53120 [Pseudomonas amygdali pv. tabaci]|nr:hypothetical protein Pta6605_53120 [Pseudomonas amygdali pv. tabaci]
MVPMLRIGMHFETLCAAPTIQGRTQSVQNCIPTRSVGTIVISGIACNAQLSTASLSQ